MVARFTAVPPRIYTGVFSFSETIPIVCTNCGYTVYYTSDPEKVRKYYLK